MKKIYFFILLLVTSVGYSNVPVDVKSNFRNGIANPIKNGNSIFSNRNLSLKNESISAAVTATINIDSEISCNGNSNGQITATAAGGTAPYSYLWDNGSTTATISGLTAGTYSVTITDDLGATSNASVTLNEPSLFFPLLESVSSVSCFGGNDGAATVSGYGGTAPYNYSWSNGTTTGAVTSLTAGIYSVVVTDDNGCSTSTAVLISEPNELLGNSAVDNNVTCNGLADGQASINPSGGTAPYSYIWSDGTTTATNSGLDVGNYSYTLTDDNSCTATGSISITEPAVLSASAVIDANVSCNGGSDGQATVSVVGGTSPYTYLWDNGATSATATGLSVGVYNVTITDANSCTATSSVTITEPTAMTWSTMVDANVSCNGGNDGAATASATGGTAPYTYLWDNGATTASTTGLSAGTFTCVITDANGCNVNAGATITEPTVLLSSILSSTNVSCNGGGDGAATVDVNGGVTPYTYLWSNGETSTNISGVTAGTYTVTATDANACASTSTVTITEPTALNVVITEDASVTCNGNSDGQVTANVSGGTAPYSYLWDNGGTTPSISGLAAGTYSVTITDDNACTVTQSVTVSEPAILEVNTVVDANVSCNGSSDGQATANVNGGTAPYTYLWDNGATTATVSGLVQGVYSVNVVDANGCATNGQVTITEPVLLTATSTVDANVSCNGLADGQVTVSALDGTAPYTYLWDNGATTAMASGLSVGTYTVTVTDANGCNTTATATVTEPVILVATTQVDNNVSCNGAADGSATASVTGGTAPYSYLWDNGATTASVSGLAPGTYSVTVTDNNTCTATQTVVIDLASSQIGTYTVTYTSNGFCPSSTDVIVELYGLDVTTSVSGITITANNTNATSYQWVDCDNNNEEVPGATNASFTPTVNGNYAVLISDENCSDISACVTIDNVGIKENNLTGQFKAYPNPTNGEFNIDFAMEQEKLSFKVFDLSGKIVLVEQYDHTAEVQFNFDFPKGVYLLEITDQNNNRALVRVVKQ